MPKNVDPWRSHRDNIRAKRTEPITQFVMDSGCPGTFSIIVTTRDFPFPLGTLYVRAGSGKTYEILDLQVRSTVRRCGLGKELIDRFVALCEANNCDGFTQAVTDLSRRLVKRAGFLKADDGYWLRRR